ncbi:hypothetical protein KRP22_002659 [Phytophthora ramorum]|nr:hypothetical protein KRP22_6306 [Phytophthora ramorum]
MEAAAFSTGVSIQYPHGRSAAIFLSSQRTGPVDYPFPFPASSKTFSESQYRADTEAYSVCQELAYHFACEKTRKEVQELLRKNNDTSYSQVLRFLEKYCARNMSEVGVATAPSPSSRRQRDPNAPVMFPEFHAFPTAAVIAGTDATSSDLWVEPLTLTLRRTFPLCFLAPRDVPTARKFVEWLAARTAKMRASMKREERWLETQVYDFDLLPLDRVTEGCVGGRVTRQQLAKDKADRGTARLMDEQDDAHSDASCYSESSSSSEDAFEDEAGNGRRGKRKRRLPSVAYGRWTMTKLLTTIQNDVEQLTSPTRGDVSHECVTALEELVHNRLQDALAKVKKVQEKEVGVVTQSIECFDEAVAWLQRKLTMCHDTAATLLNVAPISASNKPTTMHVGATELALALMLQRVLDQYGSFLESCMFDLPVVTDRRKSVAQVLYLHEEYYTLKPAGLKESNRFQASMQTPTSPRPFLLLCIEQLEAFSQQVLGDFLEIWTHFVRQQQEKQQSHKTNCNLGFIVGVASATSPALRRLDVAVTNRLELQFFSLVDSRKCFDDVLESLVVKAKLPFALSGEVLRTIAKRHQRLPSVPRLLLALRFLLFTHFRRCPWSFLALAVDGLSSSGVSPILAVAKVARLPPQHRVSVWVKHQRRRLAREAQGRNTASGAALASWLTPCSALELADLASRVMPTEASPGSVGGEDNWMTVLETGLLDERRRQARWRMGWECFRSACSWMDVPIGGVKETDKDQQEEPAVMNLALALEGRLAEAPCFMEVLRRLQNSTRWAVLSILIENWRSSFRAFGIFEADGDGLDSTLGELSVLCAYARTQKTPAKMLVALREELVAVFTGRLITALLDPSARRTVSPANTLVANWSVLTDANVLDERLRFEYHDNLRNVLQDAGIGEDIDSNKDAKAEASWVHDVGLAFLFYQENASASLSLHEWYESFSSELKEETKSAPKSKNKKRKAADVSDDAAIKARFVRAVCTLRHWGFIKSDAPRDLEQDIIEKLVFI